MGYPSTNYWEASHVYKTEEKIKKQEQEYFTSAEDRAAGCKAFRPRGPEYDSSQEQ